MIIRILSILLAVQLAVTVYLYWPRDLQRGPAPTLVSSVAREAVTKITVSDTQSEVQLTRSGDRWLLDSGLPADPVKVTAVLTALLEADPGYAIAASDSAARRFKVDADDFERRITLAGGDASASVFLGTSPAFRKVHGRRAGDPAIYVLELNSYDAPTSAASWLDRNLLQMTGVDAIRMHDRRYTLGDQGWEDADGSAADPARMEQLLQVLSSLRVTGLADEEDAPRAQDGEARLALTATSGGRSVDLTLAAVGDDYFISSSEFGAWFAISAYDAERLLETAGQDSDGQDTGEADDSLAGDEVAGDEAGADPDSAAADQGDG